MKLVDLFAYVKSLSENDQSILDVDIYRWVDSAIDRINIACKSSIPKTTGQPTTYEPEFDTRFHEALLLFAEARYRESDSDYNASQYFMRTFNEMVSEMQRDMTIKPSMRADNQVQQIVVSNASTMIYTLTMDYGSYFDLMSVYKNDVLVDPKWYTTSINNKTITFKGVTFAINDKITIVFENNSDLNNPPYGWWTF